MNCQEALDLLYEFIDKETSDIDTQQIQAHLKKCGDCFQKYRLESSIQEFIHAKLADDKPAVSLDRLKSKVFARLDQVDREECGPKSGSPYRLAFITVAAAALLVLMIGGAGIITDFITHTSTYVPLEQAHFAMVESSRNTDSEFTAESVISLMREQNSYELRPNLGEFVLRSGKTEEILGVVMNHLIYSSSAATVSVFIVPADKFSIPDDLLDTKIVRGDLELFDHNCPACRLVFHVIGSIVVITATSDQSIELLDFIPGQLVA
jgi:mycothiol system anti-sigma-R factor